MFLADIPLNIDWQQILLHLLNFVILVGGLYFLLYSPVKKFMQKRKEHYDKMDNDAKTNLANAKQKEEEIDEKLNNLDVLLQDKRKQAETELADYKAKQIAEANLEAEAIIAKAQVSAKHEKEKLLDSANKEIKDLVTEATKKVVSSSTSDIFDQFLESTKVSDQDENN